MKSKKKEIIIFIFLVLLLIILNYSFIDSRLESFLLGDLKEKVFVERIIDGDTIVTEIGNVRLLGINTPERGEPGFQEAKEFLEDLILNKSIILEYVGERRDKYGRILAYIYFEGENINIRLVEQGYGNYYFYSGKDIYSSDLEEAWEICLEREKGICEKSENICGECIKIDGKKIVNQCSFDCDLEGWEIKEEGRNKFVFSGVLENGREMEFELDLADSGGTRFLYDREGGIVDWKR